MDKREDKAYYHTGSYSFFGNAKDKKLRGKIGLFSLTSSEVGMILGAGIYALIGEAAGVAVPIASDKCLKFRT